MAHSHSNSKNNSPNANVAAGGGETEVKPTTFHDFLGNKGQYQDSDPVAGGGRKPPAELYPADSASPDASSCGGRGPISATSGLGSERNISNHLEGIPFYGSRGDFTGPETSNRFTGTKRSNSNSFVGSLRDKFPQGQTDSLDSPLLTKLLRYSGGDQPRQPRNEESSFILHQVRPASLVSQSSIGIRTDANPSNREKAIPLNVGPILQYPPLANQVKPFSYQEPSSRFKDANAGPPVLSQTAADEGSRTGIKGSGILSSVNSTGGISRRQPAGVLIRSGKQQSSVSISEPKSSTTPSQRVTESKSTGRQMTIFYGGQAHVFDNVHPNKLVIFLIIMHYKNPKRTLEQLDILSGQYQADIIMALAKSNGGSWSTTFTPYPVAKPSNGVNGVPCGETDGGIAILRELRGGPSNKGDS